MNSDNFYAQIHLTMTNIYIKKRLFSRPRSNDTHSLFVATSCYWYGYVKRRITVFFFCQLIIMVVKIMMKRIGPAHWSSTRIYCDWFWKIEWPLFHAVSQWGGFQIQDFWSAKNLEFSRHSLSRTFFRNCSMLNFFTKIRHFKRLTSVNLWVTRIFLFSSAGSNLYSRKLSQ